MAQQEFYTILTAAGLAYEANRKAAGLPIKLTQMSVGDGNGAVYNPDASQTALRREVWRGAINALLQDATNPSYLVGELSLPNDVGGWYVREVGFWTDTGVLYAVGKYPESFKPLLAAGAGKEFYIRAIFETGNAESVTLVVDDTIVKATRAFVIDYVAAELAKRDSKNSVRVATTGAIVLSGAQGIDGVAVVAGDRVLVKNQASGSQNGIYVAAVGAWSRAADANESIEVTPGLLVPVEEGSQGGDSVWQLVTDGPIVLGSTALAFEMVAGRTGVNAGSYGSVTVDKFGRVIAGTNPSTLAEHGITDGLTKVEALRNAQSQVATAFTTAGSSSTYTLAPVPALDAYAVGQRFRVKFHAAGSALNSLSISGLGLKSLMQYAASGALVAAPIAAGQLADVEYNGTYFVVLNPLPAASVLPYGYFSGFQLANNAGAPTTTVDVGPGEARDKADTVNLKLSSVVRGVLQSAGAWAAGDGQNKLDTGVRAINTWYHVFVIRKSSDGTTDVLFSLSATAPSLPAGYAGFRRISAIRTDSGGGITQFFNFGRKFIWKTIILDATTVVSTPILITLSVPPGVSVMARFWANAYGSGDSGIVFMSPSADSITFTTVQGTPYAGGFGMATTAGDYSGTGADCIAENAQVRFHGLGSSKVFTYGWEEIE